MEEINEKLKRAATQYKWQVCGREQHEISFKAGADWMRKEMTRWCDPNKPPTDEMRVIAKVVLPNGATLVTGAWYAVNEFPTGWSVDLDRTFENLHVLGWRPIYENE